MSRYRCWCFTLNNPSEEEVTQLLTVFEKLCADFAAQEELGVRNKTPHIQGYLYFKNNKTHSAVQKLIPRGYIRKARKAIAARQYCLKADTRNGRQWFPKKEPIWKPPTGDDILRKAQEKYNTWARESWIKILLAHKAYKDSLGIPDTHNY